MHAFVLHVAIGAQSDMQNFWMTSDRQSDNNLQSSGDSQFTPFFSITNSALVKISVFKEAEVSCLNVVAILTRC
jgi:hypothetical protein